jgi:hypothetical protein
MNQNKSALDRLKEIEAEKKEIEAALLQEKENVEFPIYTKIGTVFSKQFSKSKAVEIKTDEGYMYIQSYDWTSGSVKTGCWADYIMGKTEPITPEEFEAARTLAIQKFSEL